MKRPVGTLPSSRPTSAEATRSVHREAHRLVAREVMEVTTRDHWEPTPGANLYLDTHHLGAGQVSADDVADAHQKDVAVEASTGQIQLLGRRGQRHGDVPGGGSRAATRRSPCTVKPTVSFQTRSSASTRAAAEGNVAGGRRTNSPPSSWNRSPGFAAAGVGSFVRDFTQIDTRRLSSPCSARILWLGFTRRKRRLAELQRVLGEEDYFILMLRVDRGLDCSRSHRYPGPGGARPSGADSRGGAAARARPGLPQTEAQEAPAGTGRVLE